MTDTALTDAVAAQATTDLRAALNMAAVAVNNGLTGSTLSRDDALKLLDAAEVLAANPPIATLFRVALDADADADAQRHPGRRQRRTPPVNVTVTVTENDAQHLVVQATENFGPEQPDRWEALYPKGPGMGTQIVGDPLFAAGTMEFCERYLDALIVRDLRAAQGHQAEIVWDLAALNDDDPGAGRRAGHRPGYVVVSSLPWQTVQDRLVAQSRDAQPPA